MGQTERGNKHQRVFFRHPVPFLDFIPHIKEVVQSERMNQTNVDFDLSFLELRKGSKIKLIIFAEFSAKGYPPPPLRGK